MFTGIKKKKNSEIILLSAIVPQTCEQLFHRLDDRNYQRKKPVKLSFLKNAFQGAC